MCYNYTNNQKYFKNDFEKIKLWVKYLYSFVNLDK